MIDVLDRVLTFFWRLFVGTAAVVSVVLVVTAIAQPENVDINWLQYQLSDAAMERAGLTKDIKIDEATIVRIQQADLVSKDARLAWFSIPWVGSLLAIGLFGFKRLRSIVRSAAEGTPFVMENVQRIRHIGFVYIGLHMVGWAGMLAAALIVQSRLPDYMEGGGIDLDMRLGWIVTALLIFALAEVFRTGVDLQEDRDLTV